jgi:hypothetical protein
MPSDDAYDRIGAVFAPAAAAFRSAVTDAVEQVRSYIAVHSATGDSPGTGVESGLGAFGAGHIDETRFAALFADGDTLDADTLRIIERALSVLKDLSTPDDPAFTVEVAAGGDVATVVGSAFASIGRAFGAARIAGLVRAGRIDDAAKDDSTAPFPFDRWTATERRMAPALVVRLAGADLDAAPLAAWLDGNQKIVLIVEPPAPAAALARLITPGTFVMQTVDPRDTASLSAFDGPGIAALVPEGCATFVHDPSAEPSGRLLVTAKPTGKPRALRRSSMFQQTESLALLDVLERALNAPAAALPVRETAQPAAVPAKTVVAALPDGTAQVVDPADTLAAWLLAQAGMGAAGATADR